MTRPLAAVLVLVSVVLSGCRLSGLEFEQDTRIHFVAPKENAVSYLPIVLTWTAHGVPASDVFALFVDRAPIQPGQNIDAVADSQCRAVPGCFDRDYLNEHQVYLTQQDTFTLTSILHPPSSHKTTTADIHTVTIVLLNSDGVRIDESEFSRDFDLRVSD